MKKKVSLVVAAMMAVFLVSAQSVADGIKFLGYEKYKSAIETLQKAYDANPKDPQTIYWYGQALLNGQTGEPNKDDIAKAKALYQKALQEGINDAWILVGMGHVGLFDDGDLNAAKQKFEQAITQTIETKGKNKGKPSAAILSAIGRANADGSSKIGDPVYGIDKLKQAAELDKTSADIMINMGICYQKMGGENGGDAVKAYTDAMAREPKNPLPPYHIGVVYFTQNNLPLFEENFNKALADDPAFPPAYYKFYQYYELRDINKAKEYLDSYIKYADKSCATDFYYANYLLRAGSYQESLNKANEMKNGSCADYPPLNILFAYNYDRLNDSVQAKVYVDKYFAAASIDKIKPTDYELAIKIYSKFPGNEATTAAFLQKAIDNDTSKVNKLTYMNQAANMFANAKMYTEQLQWLQKYMDLKGSMGEGDYYKITATAYNAKDYVQTMTWAQKYITAYSDKPQGYYFNVRAAKALDTTSNPGIAIDALNQQDDYLLKDTAKNKRGIISNYYYLMSYYSDKMKDYEKALEIADKILVLIPNDPDMLPIRKILEDAVKKEKKSDKGGIKEGSKNSSNTPPPKPETHSKK
jgi:tetratricopeptide (TPR) repeat protein